jgi:hypothetical protein
MGLWDAAKCTIQKKKSGNGDLQQLHFEVKMVKGCNFLGVKL